MSRRVRYVCTVLYGIVMWCIVLYCVVSNCTALHCTALYCTDWHGVLYCAALCRALCRAHLEVAHGEDDDAVVPACADDARVAVGLAGVVDEMRDGAGASGIHHATIVQREHVRPRAHQAAT
eukprot:1195064-Prorocentrum_minimum.AAC.3